MTKALTNKEAAELLRSRDHFVIINHRRPDGDAVGCAAALCRSLRKIGKTAAVWKNPQTTERYQPYLCGLETETLTEESVLVSVDMATEGLLPLNAEAFAGNILLSIDHHPSNSGYAVYTDVHPECAACGETILEIVKELSGTPDREIAEALYLAISTDTGCFQYSNVTEQTLRAAAELKACGADIFSINKVMFGTKTIARLRLESMLTEGAEFYGGGLVCVCRIPLAMMDRTGATEDDVDDISGFPRSIEGVQIGIMLRELKEGGTKISLRTSEAYNASEICGVLGGGGHRAAAGATVQADMETTKEKILDAVKSSGVVL